MSLIKAGLANRLIKELPDTVYLLVHDILNHTKIRH